MGRPSYGAFDPRPLKSGRVKGGRSYLLVDNTVSGGARVEVDTMTCAHCNTVVVPNPQRTRERGHCHRCNAYVCDKPGCRAECVPTDETIDLAFSLTPDRLAGVEGIVARAPDGGLLFDRRLLDRKRIR